MKKISKRLALMVCLCAANSAFAAATDEDLNKYEGDEYVVTATRTELTTKEVPQTVEVITKEEIQEIGAISVRDVLKTATNIYIADGGGGHGDHLSIRGSDSNDILILINGRRIVGENIYGNGSGNNRALDRLNLSNVERIEVVRGQAGALYGSDAQAGVINIITRKSEKPEFTVGFSTGSREMNNYYHIDTGKEGKLSATFDATFGKLRNFDGKAGIGFVDGPTQYYSLDMDYDMDENNKLNLFLEYNKEDFDYQVSYASSGIPGVYDSNRKQERKTGSLTYEGKNENSNYSVSATYSRLETDSSGHSLWLDTSVRPPSIGVIGTEEDRTYSMYLLEARDSINTSENNKLTFGGEFRRNEGSAYIDGGDDTTDQYAVYLQDEYRVSDKLLLVPSVRYNHHEDFGSKTTPNMGLTYFIADNSRLKANYGMSYRAPSIDELYGTFNHMGMFTVYGNPDLEPETTTGYEISYEHEFGDTTSAKLTYFNNEKEDAITMEKIGIGSDRHYVNVEEAETEGVEFEVKQELGNGFTLSGNYAWLDAQNKTTGEKLSYSARNTYTAKLQWVEPVNKEWSVTAWNRWYSDFYDGSDTYSGNTFNFVVNKRFGDKYRVFAGIDNLFNKEIDGLNYYGRLWRVGAEMTF